MAYVIVCVPCVVHAHCLSSNVCRPCWFAKKTLIVGPRLGSLLTSLSALVGESELNNRELILPPILPLIFQFLRQRLNILLP